MGCRSLIKITLNERNEMKYDKSISKLSEDDKIWILEQSLLGFPIWDNGSIINQEFYYMWS